ncbi:hypothetical protein ACLMLE_17780 [Lysobacter capsici]
MVAHLSYAPSLYIAQLDTVLRFFGLDTVGEGVSSMQMRIDELRARAKARGGDFREIKFQRDPRPSERGDHPISIPWGAIGFFLAMLVLSIAMTMRTPTADESVRTPRPDLGRRRARDQARLRPRTQTRAPR